MEDDRHCLCCNELVSPRKECDYCEKNHGKCGSGPTYKCHSFKRAPSNAVSKHSDNITPTEQTPLVRHKEPIKEDICCCLCCNKFVSEEEECSFCQKYHNRNLLGQTYKCHSFKRAPSNAVSKSSDKTKLKKQHPLVGRAKKAHIKVDVLDEEEESCITNDSDLRADRFPFTPDTIATSSSLGWLNPHAAPLALLRISSVSPRTQIG
jgi:hypothetical protein